MGGKIPEAVNTNWGASRTFSRRFSSWCLGCGKHGRNGYAQNSAYLR